MLTDTRSEGITGLTSPRRRWWRAGTPAVGPGDGASPSCQRHSCHPDSLFLYGAVSFPCGARQVLENLHNSSCVSNGCVTNDCDNILLGWCGIRRVRRCAGSGGLGGLGAARRAPPRRGRVRRQCFPTAAFDASILLPPSQLPFPCRRGGRSKCD